MKVGIDVSQAIYGTGVSDYTLNLIHNLPQDVILPFGYSLRRRKEIPGLSFPFPPSLMHYLWNKFHIVNVENLIGKIDVYHSSDWTQGPSRASKVTTVHDLAPFLYPSETLPEIVAVHTARMSWVVKECDKIICVSQSTANDLIKLFPTTENRIIVIPEALPARYLKTPSNETSDGDYVLAIGARQPRKNIARLISANLSQKLIIIGERPQNLTIAPSSNVEFTGVVSDQKLVDLMSNASCFVYPSLYEGFGLPILGAFHHRVPVACSDIQVFHETAGAAAVYFNPQDEESISSAVSQAIKNKSKLIAAGTKQLAKFSWSQTANQTLAVYNSFS